MRAGKLTEDQRQDICKAYREGVSSTKLANQYGLNKKTIVRCLRKNNVNIRPIEERNRRYPIDDTYLDDISTEEKAYFLGLMWSDGNIPRDLGSFNLSLHAQDRYMLKIFSKIFYKGKDVSKIRKDNTGVIKISSKKLARRLVDLGCVPNKSLSIKFPDWLTDNLYSAFIRGLLDGDGSIIIGKIRPEVSFTGTQELLVALSSILKNKLDVKSNMCKANRNNSKNTYYLHITGYNNIKKFLDWIYCGANIYLIRKHNKFQEFMIKYGEFAKVYYTNEEIRNILIEYNKGVTVLEIAKYYGCDSRTIKTILKRNGSTQIGTHITTPDYLPGV